MDIEKAGILVQEIYILDQHECRYRRSNQIFPTCLDHQATQPKDKEVLHKTLRRSWECVGADIFSINNKHYLFHCRLLQQIPVVKNARLSFSEYRLHSKIFSDAGTNFISGKVQDLVQKLGI